MLGRFRGEGAELASSSFLWRSQFGRGGRVRKERSAPLRSGLGGPGGGLGAAWGRAGSGLRAIYTRREIRE